MADGSQLIKDAFAAYEDGDLALLKSLFAADARWIGVPRGCRWMFKVLTFCSGENIVVRLNDCLDESYALQVLAP